MKFSRCFTNVITTWSAWFIVNASAEALKEGQKVSLATKLLQSTVPLVLLWGGDMPPSLSNHTCWKSTKIRPAPGASFYHEVETGWLGDPSIQDLKNKVATYLTLREENGHATLHVEALARNSFGARIQGNYHIVYADTLCMILRPSNPKGSKVCTVWVPATTAAFKHTACRSAFKAMCVSNDNTCQ